MLLGQDENVHKKICQSVCMTSESWPSKTLMVCSSDVDYVDPRVEKLNISTLQQGGAAIVNEESLVLDGSKGQKNCSRCQGESDHS